MLFLFNCLQLHYVYLYSLSFSASLLFSMLYFFLVCSSSFFLLLFLSSSSLLLLYLRPFISSSFSCLPLLLQVFISLPLSPLGRGLKVLTSLHLVLTGRVQALRSGKGEPGHGRGIILATVGKFFQAKVGEISWLRWGIFRSRWGFSFFFY